MMCEIFLKALRTEIAPFAELYKFVILSQSSVNLMANSLNLGKAKLVLTYRVNSL